jgi:hypothetical protein
VDKKGTYDDRAKKIQDELHAACVIVGVVGGKEGSGFSVVASTEVLDILPAVLREIADKAEEENLIRRAREN